MKKLKEDTGRYILFEDESGRPYLDVLCGRVGLFVRRVILSQDEGARVGSDDDYARELAKRIETRPDDFSGRCVDNPPDLP